MSNVKTVRVVGRLPFCCDEHDEMCRIMGNLCRPTLGIRLRFSTQPVGHQPNEHGGETAMYSFAIEGREAVSEAFITRIVKTVNDCGGEVSEAFTRDIENPHSQPVFYDFKTGETR